jgi:hypothetical protein
MLGMPSSVVIETVADRDMQPTKRAIDRGAASFSAQAFLDTAGVARKSRNTGEASPSTHREMPLKPSCTYNTAE